MGEKCSWTMGEYKREAKSKWINDHISTSNCSPISGSQPTQENHEFTLKQTAFIWMWEHYLEIFFWFNHLHDTQFTLKGKKKQGQGAGRTTGGNSLGSKFSKWLVPSCVLSTRTKSISELASLRVHTQSDSSLTTLHPRSFPEKKQQGLVIRYY